MKVKNIISKIDISSKLLVLATIVLVASVMIASVYYQSSPVVWFMDSSQYFMMLRGAMIVLLLVLLFSNPPRSILFRTALLIGSVVFGVVAFHQLFSYSMHFIDMAVSVQVGIILAIEALEFRRETQNDTVQPRKIPVTVV